MATRDRNGNAAIGDASGAADSPEHTRAFSSFIKLCRATWTVTSRVASCLPGNITFAQFAVLEALSSLGPMTQKDIATKILRSSASVTSVVDKLERRGLVQRRRSEDDRRLVGVSLTEEGRSLMREVLPVYMGTVKQEFSVLTPAEQAYLGELCKKLGMAQQGPEGTIETEWMKGET